MGRVFVGSFLAAIVVFVWAIAFWSTSLSEGAHARAPDGRALADQLDEALPRSGTYVIPQRTVGQKERVQRQSEGPVATIHFRKAGVEAVSARRFFGGFMQQWVTFFLAGLLLWMVADRFPEFGERAGFVAVIGLASVMWTEIGDIVWFHVPAGFATMGAVYDLLAWVMGGIVMGAVVRREYDGDHGHDDEGDHESDHERG